DYWLVRCHPSATAPATNPANWGGEVRLTDTSFDLEKAQPGFDKGSPYFVGDYEGLTTVGNDFLAAWGQPHDTDLDSVFFRRAFSAEPLLAPSAGHNDLAATLMSQQVAALLPEAIPLLLCFTETDPVTLAYTGGENLRPALLPSTATGQTVLDDASQA